MKFANYGQKRTVDATDDEIRIFELIQELTGEDLELVRKSKDYVTVMFGEWDLVRIKYTSRARWLKFPALDVASVKYIIDSPEDVKNYSELIDKSLTHIRKYS